SGTTTITLTAKDASNNVSTCQAFLIVQTNTTVTAIGNKTNCPGTSVTFTTTASGTGPFSYVWRKGVAIVQGPDANNSYTIASVVAGDASAYSVEVTGTCNA